jgi:hypothetical protein
MKLDNLIQQGFRLYCKMYPSDKYSQGIATPGVYLLCNEKEDILKIGQSVNLYRRFNRMYKCISNTTNNKIRDHIKNVEILWAYALPMQEIKSNYHNDHAIWELSTSFAPSLEKILLKEYKNIYNKVPLLNSGVM